MKYQNHLHGPRVPPRATSHSRAATCLLLIASAGLGCDPGMEEASALDQTDAGINEVSAQPPPNGIELIQQPILKSLEKYVPKDIKALAKGAKELSGLYSDYKDVLALGIFLGEAVGLLQKRQSTEEGIQDIQNRLEALSKQIAKTGAQLNRHESARDRSDRVATALRAVVTAEQAIKSGATFTAAWPAAENSAVAAMQAMGDPHFEGFYVPEATEGEWSHIITQRPVVTDGFTYDWRLGVPALMQIIAARISVIAALDRNFKTSGVYRNELLSYRTAIQGHIDRMRGGIHCNYTAERKPNFVQLACADIHTGLSAVVEFKNPTNYFQCVTRLPDRISVDPHCRAREDQKWRNFEVAELNPARELLSRQVFRELPIFEMQSLVDQLYMYAHNPQDLTEPSPRVQSLMGSPPLCIDVQLGNPARGTPVWLWPCDGAEAQTWHYNRKSGLIRNHVYDKCLDVQWGSLVSNVTLWTWDCTRDPAQTWTWDPELGILQNELGTVVTFRGRAAPGEPIVTGFRNRITPAQRWES